MMKAKIKMIEELKLKLNQSKKLSLLKLIIFLYFLATFNIIATRETEAETPKPPLCAHLSSGQLDKLALQGFTYLQLSREEVEIPGGPKMVYLLAGNQFYSLRTPADLSGLRLTVAPPPNISQPYWEVDPILEALVEANPALQADRQNPLQGVSILLMYRQGIANWDDWVPKFYWLHSYHGLVVTTAKVHVALLTGKEADTQFTREQDAEFYDATLYPAPLRLVPRQPQFEESERQNLKSKAYVFQFDGFKRSGSPVVYRLYIAGQKPELASTATVGAFPQYYLIGDKSDPKKAELILTDTGGSVDRVKAAPLLHRTPIGFETSKGLFLLEPEIGCLYILEGFNLDGPRSLTLTRKPVEAFLTCTGTTNSVGSVKFPADRCNSVEKTDKFFTNRGPETPPPSSGGDGLVPEYPNENKRVKESGISAAIWVLIVAGVVLGLMILVLVIVCAVLSCRRSGGKGGGKRKGKGKKTVRRQLGQQGSPQQQPNQTPGGKTPGTSPRSRNKTHPTTPTGTPKTGTRH